MNTRAKISNSKNALLYNEAKPAPIVLITGSEDALADRAWRSIRTNLREKYSDLAVYDLRADSFSVGELYSLASPSLFAEPKLLRITGCDHATQEFVTEFQEVATLIEENTSLLLRHRETNRGKQFLDVARKLGALEIECPKIKPNSFLDVLRTEAKRINCKIETQAAQQLVAAYASDLEELLSALKQLAADTNGTITLAAVAELTAGKIDTTAFAIVDASLAGNFAQAITLMRHALNSGNEPAMLLGALNKAVRDMARVFGVQENAQQLAKKLEMPAWMVQKAQRNAARWREIDLAKMIVLAADTEMALKGAARDREYALEKYLFALTKKGRI